MDRSIQPSWMTRLTVLPSQTTLPQPESGPEFGPATHPAPCATNAPASADADDGDLLLSLRLLLIPLALATLLLFALHGGDDTRPSLSASLSTTEAAPVAHTPR